MSTLTALARALAVEQGRAQPITTVRHVYCSQRPMVFVPLAMAGEANAPVAAAVGDDPDHPHFLIVAQPRNRDQRFAFAAELASILLPYIDRYRGATEAVAMDRTRDTRWRVVEAPQIIVPNTMGTYFVRLLGRSTRFRTTEGAYAVSPDVPILGRWLTFLADRAEYPGSSLFLPMTEVLSSHWATGHSGLEDANLAALMAWIDPPEGISAAEAALDAENPHLWPPAGPSTSPEFDNIVLSPAITAYEAAKSSMNDILAETRAYEALTEALISQLKPTWGLLWRAIELIRALPEGRHVQQRWDEDRDIFTDIATHIAGGGPPQPRFDNAVAAARRLHRLERALTSYTTQRAYDDPLVMAEYRLTGEACIGEVIAADRLRIDTCGSRRRLRPWITITTTDRIRAEITMTLISPARPTQQARVVDIHTSAQETTLVLELSGGMGRALTPPPGSVPEVGERICYTSFAENFCPPGSFPESEKTPWTHGGPPREWTGSNDNAEEEWS